MRNEILLWYNCFRDFELGNHNLLRKLQNLKANYLSELDIVSGVSGNDFGYRSDLLYFI